MADVGHQSSVKELSKGIRDVYIFGSFIVIK